MREILEVYIPILDLHDTLLRFATSQLQSRLVYRTAREDKPRLLQSQNRYDRIIDPLCLVGTVMRVLDLLDRLDQVRNHSLWYVPSLHSSRRTSLGDEYCIMIYGKEFSNAS